MWNTLIRIQCTGIAQTCHFTIFETADLLTCSVNWNQWLMPILSLQKLMNAPAYVEFITQNAATLCVIVVSIRTIYSLMTYDFLWYIFIFSSDLPIKSTYCWWSLLHSVLLLMALECLSFYLSSATCHKNSSTMPPYRMCTSVALLFCFIFVVWYHEWVF